MTINCPIIPRPQKYLIRNGSFLLSNQTTIICETGTLLEGKNLESRLFKTTSIRLSGKNAKKTNKIILRLKSGKQSFKTREGYHLTVNKNKVVLEAMNRQGLSYACHAFVDLITKSKDGWIISNCEIFDWPDFSWRGFMIDPANKFIPIEQIKQYIDWMALNRFNRLHIHFTDNTAFTINIKDYPHLNERVYFPQGKLIHPFTLKELQNIESKNAGYYSTNDIQKIVQYAALLHIEIIPEIAMPSHAAALIKAFPALLCDTGVSVHTGSGKRPSEMIMCIGSERTYEIIKNIIDRVAPLFPGNYFHIGADEIECPGGSRQYQSWERCSVCRKKMEQKGFKNVRELFYYFIRRVKKILAKHNKQLIMWNDYIDIAKPVNLPKNILVQFWRIADKNWPVGPIRGCSFAQFLKSGYHVINSFYSQTYIDGYIKEKELMKWSPAIKPSSSQKNAKKIIGSTMCAWGGWEYYPWVLPSALSMFGDKLWNKKNIIDAERYSKKLAYHLYGPGIDVELEKIFLAIGSIIPPYLIEGKRHFENYTRTFPIDLKLQIRIMKVIRKQLNYKQIENRNVLKEYLKILPIIPSLMTKEKI